MSTAALLAAVPQVGRLQAILLRPERRGPVRGVPEAELLPGLGLAGDHRTATRAPDPTSRRQVTLLQAEHLAVIAALTGRDELDPGLLRRNLVVAAVNLASLRDRRFSIGEAVLEGTGWCHPCSRMEEALGPGGFQAVRGHGGITARVLTGAVIRTGQPVRVLATEDDEEAERERPEGPGRTR